MPNEIEFDEDSIFYYWLDFARNEFYIVDRQYKDRYGGDSPHIIMPCLSECPKYHILYADVIEVRNSTKDINTDKLNLVQSTMRIRVGEEMDRNEFFSQYALGTLEGMFIATRDVKFLRQMFNS